MKKSRESDSCEEIKAFYTFYTLPQAALLWCGVPPDEVDGELEKASPSGMDGAKKKAVLRHPYFPCLEPRCRVLHEAIDNSKLPAGRDGSKASLISETSHIAYDRRTIFRDDLKTWIALNFPNDKPKFLFDEIERSTHSAINADTFRTLQANSAALQVKLEKANEENLALKESLDTIEGEYASLRKLVESFGTPGERAATTYENIIGGLLGLMLGTSPAGVPQSVFKNQSAIITTMLACYQDTPGISLRTLEEKFAAARRSLESN